MVAVGHVPALQLTALYCVLPEQVWAEHWVVLLLLPLFVHTERPVEHEVTPSVQALPVLQLTAGVQAPQVPLWQYMLVPHDWPSLPAIFAQVPPTPEQSWQAGQDELAQHLEVTQLPLEHSVPAEQVAPLPSFWAPQVPPDVQFPVTQSALVAHVLLQDFPSAQVKEPLQAEAVPGAQVPAPSQTLVASAEPVQVDPHPVPLAP